MFVSRVVLRVSQDSGRLDREEVVSIVRDNKDSLGVRVAEVSAGKYGDGFRTMYCFVRQTCMDVSVAPECVQYYYYGKSTVQLYLSLLRMSMLSSCSWRCCEYAIMVRIVLFPDNFPGRCLRMRRV